MTTLVRFSAIFLVQRAGLDDALPARVSVVSHLTEKPK